MVSGQPKPCCVLIRSKTCTHTLRRKANIRVSQAYRLVQNRRVCVYLMRPWWHEQTRGNIKKKMWERRVKDNVVMFGLPLNDQWELACSIILPLSETHLLAFLVLNNNHKPQFLWLCLTREWVKKTLKISVLPHLFSFVWRVLAFGDMR